MIFDLYICHAGSHLRCI